MTGYQERALTNARMRRLLLALGELTGRTGLALIVRQARLHRFTTYIPAHNHAPDMRAVDYASLIQAVTRYYGRGARALLVHAGRLAFKELLRDQALRAGLYRVMFVGLRQHARQKVALNWLAREMALPNGRVVVREENGRLVLLDHESDATLGCEAHEPMCWFTLGEIQAALRWATGREYDVVEVTCKATGAELCRFEIGEPVT